MPLTLPTWIAAIATVVLAVGAIITSIFAIRAFGKQTQELDVIRQQAKDQQALTEQQAELLKLQGGQLDLQRQQLDDQRGANARQADVLELQAKELQESIAERLRDRDERHRDQAARLFTWVEITYGQPDQLYRVHVKNASDRPVYNLTVTLHGLRGAVPASLSFEPDASVSSLMPGDEIALPSDGPVPWDAATGPGGVWSRAWFHDAAEVRWTVTSRGEIAERP